MEIFLPSFLIIILSAVVVFTVLPRFGPLVLTVLSIVLLTFGTYHHYKMFKDEYRLASWYKSAGFGILAPALVLGVALFFILGYILSFFGSGVPVPSMPNISQITDTMEAAVNTAVDAVNNTAAAAVNNTANFVNETVNNVNRGINNSLRSGNGNNRRTNNAYLANKLP